MSDRRSFLKSSLLAASSMALCNSSLEPLSAATPHPMIEPETGGLVPDTLDLADHAGLGMNGLIGSMDPRLNYEIAFWNILDVHPAYMLHWSTMLSGVQPKYMQSLAMMRLASGTEQGGDAERQFMEAMIANMSEDGLVYDRKSPNRPWNVGVYYGNKDWDEDYANLAGNGRMLESLLLLHQASGEDRWLELAAKSAERLRELAVVEGDNAWYPNPGLGNDFSYPRASGWTTRKAPEKPNEGFEGGTMFYQLTPLRGWARYYAQTGQEQYLDVMRKFINFSIQPRFWSGVDGMNPRASAERGHFQYHFHASLSAIRGALDYALVANDQRIREWAHNAYGYVRQAGIPRLGLFPTRGHGTEGCTIADMIGLAITLSDAGMGDYWDDVDMYARNGLLCAQATDLEELNRVSAAGPERPANAEWGGFFDSRFKNHNKGNLPGQEIDDKVIERTRGAFGHIIGARLQTPMVMHCCTANCTQALYYAWEGILRRQDDAAHVNLWLNRRSPWLDVYSHVPHEGRLVIRNKGMRTITVRRPSWANPRMFECMIDGNAVQPRMLGGRAIFDGLRGNELITLRSPCTVQSAEYTLVNLGFPLESSERYSIDFKGNTALRVELLERGRKFEDDYRSDLDHDWYRLFRREALSTASAPLKPEPDYVHPKRLIHWGVV